MLYLMYLHAMMSSHVIKISEEGGEETVGKKYPPRYALKFSLAK